ncbi:uncharacterized protein HMPREF1541_08079 [Cyphellophora europaea CBS 101466]|uniref:Selenoprotein W-like protein n=1 Tax=Cyphellophora europaea (strain CBS 101466) TaxID=1220924 RepID=W2RMX9_CYPE1|nr:uncharacterized protein HMPREF1541_08079 [Cyphellophora europaea CBS 101466]ETN37089.1 hypothetical protein HMPREF1541_08079 [Cyphellophora europaea CBS 101466]
MATKTQAPSAQAASATGHVLLPRITIAFCTQCKWNLRAAYYAQELLQTFGTSLGEVALLPSTGGTFVITLYHLPSNPNRAREAPGGINDEVGEDSKQGADAKSPGEVQVQQTVVWDRKVDGGFPETKDLKGRVRDLVEPGRGLGHTDRALRKGKGEDGGADASTAALKGTEGNVAVDDGRRGDGKTEAEGGNMDAEGNAEGRAKARECEDCK